jgi:hypothetical protein
VLPVTGEYAPADTYTLQDDWLVNEIAPVCPKALTIAQQSSAGKMKFFIQLKFGLLKAINTSLNSKINFKKFFGIIFGFEQMSLAIIHTSKSIRISVIA